MFGSRNCKSLDAVLPSRVGQRVGHRNDGRGTILSGSEAARPHASVIAAELAQDGNEYRGREVFAVDDDGNEIARLPVLVPS